jgi:hypothetical protein
MSAWILLARSTELYFCVVVIGSVSGLLAASILKSKGTGFLDNRALWIVLVVFIVSLAIFTRLRHAILLPAGLLIVFLLCSSKAVRTRIERPWRLSPTSSYALSATLLIAVAGVFPCIASFKIAHDLEMELLVRSAQADIARAIAGRVAADRSKHDSAQKQRLEARRWLESAGMDPSSVALLDPFQPALTIEHSYLKPFFGTNVRYGVPSDPGEESDPRSAFKQFLSNVRIAYNRGVMQTSAIPLSRGASPWTWVQRDWPELRFRSRNSDPDSIVIDTRFTPLARFNTKASALATLPDLFVWILVTGAALTAAFAVLRYFTGFIALEAIAGAETQAAPKAVGKAVGGPGRISQPVDDWSEISSMFRNRLGSNTNAGELTEVFDNEFGKTPGLRDAARQIANGKDLERATPSGLLYEITEAAEGHYKSMWRKRSTEERFVLYHLATDGLINPVNAAIVNGLIRQGLVISGPRFEIFNDSFRLFVRSHLRRMEALAWEFERARRGSHSVRTILLCLVVLLIGFLFMTRPEIVQTSAGFFTALAAVLGALMKFLPSQTASGGSPEKPN